VTPLAGNAADRARQLPRGRRRRAATLGAAGPVSVNVHCERGKKYGIISLLYEGDTHLFFELRVALHRQYGDMVSPTRACNFHGRAGRVANA
jgi:hypothetical protein